ncbi:hypothetical protein COP2_002921 [Malus domestica]
MNLWTDDDTSLMEAFMSLSDMALFWAASSSQPTTQPTHTPLQPQSSASTSDYPKAPVATQFQLSAMPFNQETLMQSLQALIEGARESWTYAIFWQSSYDYSSADAVLGWGEGFYKDERDKAVYLKQGGVFQDSSQVSSKSLDASGSLNPFDSTEEKGDLFVADGEDADDGSDLSEDISGFQSFLRDIIPNVKVKVLKVTSPGKVDRDLISKVIEKIIEEDDEDKDSEIESLDAEDEEQVEGDEEKDVIELDADPGIIQNAERREIAVKVVVGGLGQRLSSKPPTKNLLQVPAKIEKKGSLSFSFTVEKDINQQESRGKEQSSVDKKAKLGGQRSIDNVMFDLSKFMGKEKIPQKVLKDVGELINLALSQVNNHQPLSGTTTFNRIEMRASPDPLNGIYIGAHGLHTSEVIRLRRKFGQWKEDGGTEEPLNLEFYEYVEALKLTGDPYVPAGQVAFRAKIGKGYQLPHKGIIPEEFGVVARYKGQGRLAEPGFRNPRWVDGELVILDGKYIKGGPVVGFVYWAPEYHFLAFFNRLRLQE